MMQRMYRRFPHGTLASSLVVLAISVATCFLLAASISTLLILRHLRRLQRQISDQQAQIQGLTSRIWVLENERPAVLASQTHHGPHQTAAETEFDRAPVPVVPSALSDDWEAQIGANWLNRIGTLVLVIGFALLLAFSWTRLGPAGKVGIGAASGGALLLGGVALGRRPLYQSYSVSLVAGGWALLYFTSYATYAVPPARLFTNPALPVSAMLLVSAGMVLHALRYRSEAATALAFVFAFITLHVPSPDVFTIVAAAVLAAGTLCLSYRFAWLNLPVAGAVLTYLTVAVRYGQVAADSQLATAALWVYWVCFEFYDLVRPARTWAASPLFAVNLTGFVGAWLLLSRTRSSSEAAVFLGAAAVAYLISTFARARMEPVDEERTPAPYEMASISSAALAAAALVQQFGGSRIALALGLEGELVVLAAWSLRRLWLRRAGEILLATAVGRLLLFDAFEAAGWTLVGLALVAALIANRTILPRSWPHAVAALLLMMRISYAELSRESVAASWSIAALVLMVAGQRLGLKDIQWLAVPAAAASFIQALAITAADGPVWPSAVTAFCLYGIQLAWSHGKESMIPPAASVLASFLVAALLAQKVEGGTLTVALGLEAGVLLGAGFAASNRTLRLSGLCMFVVCIGKLFVYDLRQLDAIGRTFAFLGLGVLLLAASWIYTKRRST